MKQLALLLLIAFSLLAHSGIAQEDNQSIEATKAQVEKAGVNFDHLSSMIEIITGSEADHPIAQAMLRSILTIRSAGQPVPMDDATLNAWQSDFEITSAQAQDLYKVAIRFALQDQRR
jgi:hypothetical protein